MDNAEAANGKKATPIAASPLQSLSNSVSSIGRSPPPALKMSSSPSPHSSHRSSFAEHMRGTPTSPRASRQRGFSDEAASLVGFGEGARTPARQHSQIGSPAVGKASALPGYLRDQTAGSPMTGMQTTSSTEQQQRDARMRNGMTYDDNVVDTASGRDRDSTSEHAIREHIRQRQAGQNAMDYEQQQRNL